MLKTLATFHLNIAYEEKGNSHGLPVVLVHGWPDNPRCWDKIIPRLIELGYRTIAPYLRGCSPTTFRSAQTLRSGAIAAIGQDLADLIEGLNLKNVLVVGYDWGARAGYVVGALFPERVSGLLAISAGYATSKPIRELPYELASAYWYEWFVATRQGCKAMEEDRLRLFHYLWKTWSPGWEFTEAEFQAAALSWNNDDWAPISIHAYLQRWGETTGAAEHQELEEQLFQNPPVQVPTIMLQGENDSDNLPATSEGKEQLFLQSYARHIVPGVGHFIPREAPEQVLNAIQQLLSARLSGQL
ncbi:Alpha/beta hydrolase [Fusarium sp. Ph1]|nr:Alpha/beta hydrolase [Fusarium sp. Ph1]